VAEYPDQIRLYVAEYLAQPEFMWLNVSAQIRVYVAEYPAQPEFIWPNIWLNQNLCG
jgi:hypothetical protein